MNSENFLIRLSMIDISMDSESDIDYMKGIYDINTISQKDV